MAEELLIFPASVYYHPWLHQGKWWRTQVADKPGAALSIGFAANIKPLFTQIDIDHMSWYCDLSKYDDVKANADQILQRLKAQGGPVMPPPPAKGGDGPWSAEKIALFQSWIDGGCQP